MLFKIRKAIRSDKFEKCLFIFGLLFRSHYFLHIDLKIDITYLKFSMEFKI